MAFDPVCKMEVDEKSAAATYEYQGQTYYFCAPGCKAAFEKDPEKYLECTMSMTVTGIKNTNIIKPRCLDKERFLL